MKRAPGAAPLLFTPGPTLHRALEAVKGMLWVRTVRL